ncbi:hypothetical protein Desti_3473 [Desulfomonile tiedjei DSM 6799]|uniref:Uncharacterized protein n=1 Tax=Desulfomonile tiedjei (strain ATCC 49306 / DSM 6799 / DCB-1) TaxID=706587 RepID=I4C983_DESTA|nr:hypothetical protein Desti_3473 [Desulfomonile tiedjei DSM 6799]
MQNDIPEKQSSDRLLEYLAASSYLYGRAKVRLGCQILFTVLIPILFSIITVLVGDSQDWKHLKVWAVAYGVALSILDVLFLDSEQKRLKLEAAKIQEIFDCELFDMEWRTFKIGSKPSAESIVAAAKAYKKTAKNEIDKTWYAPEVGDLPLYQGIVACQRSNVMWDANLRRRYNKWIRLILTLAIILTIVIGIGKQLSVSDLVLSVFAPISPAILWAIREYRRQVDTCDTLDKLIKHADSLWTKAKDPASSPEKITTEARFLQDEIYDHRRSCPLIFDRIHDWLKDEQEEQMRRGVQELVREAQVTKKDETEK